MAMKRLVCPNLSLRLFNSPPAEALYWDARHARSGRCSLSRPTDSISCQAPPSSIGTWTTPGAEELHLEAKGCARLRPLFHQELPKADADPEILDVGFGTSEVPTRLFEDGWRCVTAIDASAEGVRLAQQRRPATQKALQFLQAL